MAEWRQRAERYPLPLPLRYRVAGDTAWSTGRAKNISGSGVLFASDGAIAVGTQIELLLFLESDGEPLPSEVSARALIVRVAEDGQQSSQSAIAARFLEHRLLPRRLE